jgi:hypothetical protein
VSALHNRIIVTSSTYFVSGVFSLFILFTLATNRRLVVLPLSPQRLWAAWAASTTRGRRGTHAHAHVHAQTAQSTPLFLRRHLILLIYPIFEIKFSITFTIVFLLGFARIVHCASYRRVPWRWSWPTLDERALHHQSSENAVVCVVVGELTLFVRVHSCRALAADLHRTNPGTALHRAA